MDSQNHNWCNSMIRQGFLTPYLMMYYKELSRYNAGTPAFIRKHIECYTKENYYKTLDKLREKFFATKCPSCNSTLNDDEPTYCWPCISKYVND